MPTMPTTLSLNATAPVPPSTLPVESSAQRVPKPARPGWYADPFVEGGMRYYNGVAWNPRAVPPPPPSPLRALWARTRFTMAVVLGTMAGMGLAAAGIWMILVVVGAR